MCFSVLPAQIKEAKRDLFFKSLNINSIKNALKHVYESPKSAKMNRNHCKFFEKNLEGNDQKEIVSLIEKIEKRDHEQLLEYQSIIEQIKSAQERKPKKKNIDLISKYQRYMHSLETKRDVNNKRLYSYYYDFIKKNNEWFMARYRLLPNWSNEEISNDYNLYNARWDALKQRKSWREIYQQQYAEFYLEAFYEWVDYLGKKTQIEFKSKNETYLKTLVLWDENTSLFDFEITSFAIVTTDPCEYVLHKGHDRSPCFLDVQNKISSQMMLKKSFSNKEIKWECRYL